MMGSRIKGAMGLLLYAKVSHLTTYIIKTSDIGKITNLLANDLSTLDMKLAPFFNGFVLPIILVGNTILFITRLGWPGILGALIFFLLMPLSNCISKKNGSLISQMNVHKDKRVQICT
jgi:hypothetical protein